MQRSLSIALLFATLSCAGTPGVDELPDRFEVTIDELLWVDGPGYTGLQAHLEDWGDAPTLHEFTSRADRLFFLRGDNHVVEARCGTGGVTSSKRGRLILLRTQPALTPGQTYTLHPRNAEEAYRWNVVEGLSLTH